MTLGDAARIVGLDLDERPDRKAVKRAYLRQVKTTNPEQDPEGFARLREAYELLDNHVSWHESAPIPLPVTPAGDGAAQGVSLDHESQPEVDDASETAPEYDELAPYLERLHALSEDEPWGNRAKIAREALAAFPENESARRLLLRCLPTDNDFAKAEALTVLQTGVEKGQMAFLPALVRHAPERVPAAALEQAISSKDPEMQIAAVELSAIRNAGQPAVDMLDQITRTLHDRGLTHVYLEDILRAVLVVVYKNGPELGAEAFRRVEQNLNIPAIEWLQVSPQATFYFGIITELPDVANLLPGFIIRSIAGDSVWEDRDSSPRAIAHHLETLSRRERKHLRATFPGTAPTIYQIVSAGFEDPPRPEVDWTASLNGRLLFALAWICFVLIRACACAN